MSVQRQMFWGHFDLSTPGMQQGSKIREEGQVVLGGDNVSPLVEIGLTDPPKSGGGRLPSTPQPCLPPCCMPAQYITVTYRRLQRPTINIMG